MSGKAAKQAKNKKAEKNQKIAELVQHYFLTEQEIPEFIANIGTEMGQKYAQQLNAAILHLSIIASNLNEIRREVKASTLSKASKEKIYQWLDACHAEDPDADEKGSE